MPKYKVGDEVAWDWNPGVVFVGTIVYVPENVSSSSRGALYRIHLGKEDFVRAAAYKINCYENAFLAWEDDLFPCVDHQTLALE